MRHTTFCYSLSNFSAFHPQNKKYYQTLELNEKEKRQGRRRSSRLTRLRPINDVADTQTIPCAATTAHQAVSNAGASRRILLSQLLPLQEGAFPSNASFLHRKRQAPTSCHIDKDMDVLLLQRLCRDRAPLRIVWGSKLL